ncbi:MAG: pre-peptidase C-terminal domain-containing protein [Leptolyngbyaceae cyanobacterium MO_188.B28]|nr:pre-peptidase C-terminal domain-containing protein [Leptolyngbyaceae cyanobacterium MO_188.B28]
MFPDRVMVNRGISGGVLTVGVIVGLSWGSALEASPIDAEQLQSELQLALCLNEWEYALDVISPLIASPDISADEREDFVQFRYQLQNLREMGAIVGNIPNCEAVIARVLPEPQVDPGNILDWPTAVEAVTTEQGIFGYSFGADIMPINQPLDPQAEVAAARTPRPVETTLPYLTPAFPIDTSDGSAVVAGIVGSDYKVYSFVGRLGDRISLDVDVTYTLPGSLYKDDDSQLFLFDSQGVLMAENDDLDGLQSRISNIPLPRTSTYYVVVTTYNNDPILNSEQVVSGWSDGGGSTIEFTLTLSGVTPLTALVR